MTDARIIRFAAVLVVLAGYVFVFRAGEARIGNQTSDNAATADRLRADERTLALRNTFETEGRRLRARLRSAETNADRSGLVAHFLHEAAAIAAARHTSFTTISAAGTQPAATEAAAVERTFEALPLDVTLEGRYADVLATVRVLSTGPVPATVDVASLARKNAAAADATLTASLRVVLERIVPGAAGGSAGG